MARPIWTGVLTFGLVTLPVGLYTATEDHTVHFHQLQRGTSDRIRNKRVNERTGKEVAPERIVKGYELDEGEYVVVEPEELEGIAPGRSKAIELAGFVDLHQVAPVYFARAYYVGPRGKEYLKVYELLRAALERSDKAGIATLTMRGKEYLTALRAQQDVLVLHTLHWADEVRDPADVVPELPQRRTKADSKELRTAQQLIDALTIDWDPGEYHDTYEERVKKLVAAKRKGEEVVGEPEPPEATNVIDLMEALSRSVEQSRSRGRKAAREKPAAGRKEAGSVASRKATAARKQSRKRTAGRKEGEDLGALSKAELRQRASAAGVPGRSKMTRDQLVKALAGQAA
ncbi:non-homologous end joining protein Ku [Streptomyces filipinensis]|uniref:Non-homologous end joining protein Ku n=1 Tax=Streptomyces filipinensis TaxID=66887 RepID=A0A918ICB0_9ACTN|nr:Ku protein [Streptomyces filipinensis]GGU97108.1 non-homologous end joining protein Ku [Streptomyces filipinensis]